MWAKIEIFLDPSSQGRLSLCTLHGETVQQKLQKLVVSEIAFDREEFLKDWEQEEEREIKEAEEFWREHPVQPLNRERSPRRTLLFDIHTPREIAFVPPVGPMATSSVDWSAKVASDISGLGSLFRGRQAQKPERPPGLSHGSTPPGKVRRKKENATSNVDSDLEFQDAAEFDESKMPFNKEQVSWLDEGVQAAMTGFGAVMMKNIDAKQSELREELKEHVAETKAWQEKSEADMQHQIEQKDYMMKQIHSQNTILKKLKDDMLELKSKLAESEEDRKKKQAEADEKFRAYEPETEAEILAAVEIIKAQEHAAAEAINNHKKQLEAEKEEWVRREEEFKAELDRRCTKKYEDAQAGYIEKDELDNIPRSQRTWARMGNLGRDKRVHDLIPVAKDIFLKGGLAVEIVHSWQSTRWEGSALSIGFNKAADLQRACNMVNNMQHVVPGQDKPVWLNVQQSKTERMPAVIMHRSFDFLMAVEQDLKDEGKEILPLEKRMNGKQILIEGTKKCIMFVTGTRLVFSALAKTRYGDERIEQCRAYCYNS